ncbi:hypothetical protein BX666DRAFT_1883651 [Dichotomocladium elegans]|nr:hypothetical protein BX666DRAFT_1883651 [Dichotomocladium elegans]
MNPWKYKERIVHTRHQALRKCFGCIHLRVGGVLSCIVWASLSFYFVVMSFQSKSPFYSFLPSTAPFIVFGIANLLLGFISLFTLIVLYLNYTHSLIFTSPAILVGVGAVVIDAIVNAVLFITARKGYIHWCIGLAADQLLKPSNHTNTGLNDRDFYNCDRSWQDELKFGVLGTTMIVGFYIYWGLCFRSYCIKRMIYLNQQAPQPLPSHTPGYPSLNVPPPMRMENGPAMIVLHNQKPHKKDSELFSV